MRFRLCGCDADTEARAGVLKLGRGAIPTPVFMPVGTAATVKAVEQRELEGDLDVPILLANTYHLMLRPGGKLIAEAGGLHEFMAWRRPILTDSGGFQVYSLADKCRITDEGATFKCHLDGSMHTLTPEAAIDIQRQLGSDIMMVLDECPPAGVDIDRVRNATHRTWQWALRCKRHAQATQPLHGAEQHLFAIVQGGTFPEIRQESTRALVELGFPGYAIGGLSVGERAEQMYAMVEVVCSLLPRHKPRYLMGVGTPENILACIAHGVDMFDCVLPTRNARNGRIYTTEGQLNIRNVRWRDDHRALDIGLDHYASRTFTRAYVRHLFQANEILGLQIASLQNLALYQWLMAGARNAIMDNQFVSFKNAMAERLGRRL